MKNYKPSKVIQIPKKFCAMNFQNLSVSCEVYVNGIIVLDKWNSILTKNMKFPSVVFWDFFYRIWH